MQQIAVLGDDKRMAFAAKYLSKYYKVDTKISNKTYDFIVLPFPFKKIEKNFFEKNIFFEGDITDLEGYLSENGAIAIGTSKIFFQKVLAKSKKICYNYNTEQLQQKNAAVTAEGAVAVLIENTDKAISGMKILVTGTGRISKYLVPLLDAFGAEIIIAGRNPDKATLGYNFIKCSEIASCGESFDTVINTVPAKIINSVELESLKGKTNLYIELASEPYGTDMNILSDYGIKGVCAPGLPLYNRSLHRIYCHFAQKYMIMFIKNFITVILYKNSNKFLSNIYKKI